MAAAFPTQPSELDFERELDRGFFGVVYACRRKGGLASAGKGPLWAVKKVALDNIREYDLMDQLNREVDIMRSLDHPHIIRLLFDIRDGASLYIGMEFAEGGTMFKHLSKCGKFALNASAQYFYETCDALDYIHAKGIIHRDIKPENILFDAERHVKLADFGWSNMVPEDHAIRRTYAGTPDYLAPEMVMGTGHTTSLDMWCMGVLLFEMLSGSSPFGSSSQTATAKLIVRGQVPFPVGMDADAWDLISKLLRKHSEERLTAEQANRHAFVTRNFAGRPTMIVGPADGVAVVASDWRQPTELRHMSRKKDVLEGESAKLIKDIEQLQSDRLSQMLEVEKLEEELRKEERTTEKANREFIRQTEYEKARKQDLDDLRLSTQTLEAEAVALRASTQSV